MRAAPGTMADGLRAAEFVSLLPAYIACFVLAFVSSS